MVLVLGARRRTWYGALARLQFFVDENIISMRFWGHIAKRQQFDLYFVATFISIWPSMTIKETHKTGKDETGEEEIVITPEEGFRENQGTYNHDPENYIPMVVATPMSNDENPSHSPFIHSQNASCEVHNPTTTLTTTYPQTTTSAVVAQPQQPQQQQQQPMGQGSTIPQGARWITIKHVGGVTWSLCAIISTLTCCIVLCPCGLWAFLCPCDEIRAYEINGQVYDEHGRPLGHISKLRVL